MNIMCCLYNKLEGLEFMTSRKKLKAFLIFSCQTSTRPRTWFIQKTVSSFLLQPGGPQQKPQSKHAELLNFSLDFCLMILMFRSQFYPKKTMPPFHTFPQVRNPGTIRCQCILNGPRIEHR